MVYKDFVRFETIFEKRMIRKMVQKEESNTSTKVQSIDRALSILETLADYPSLSLMELSEKVRLHKATTHRLVNSLMENVKE